MSLAATLLRECLTSTTAGYCHGEVLNVPSLVLGGGEQGLRKSAQSSVVGHRFVFSLTMPFDEATIGLLGQGQQGNLTERCIVQGVIVRNSHRIVRMATGSVRASVWMDKLIGQSARKFDKINVTVGAGCCCPHEEYDSACLSSTTTLATMCTPTKLHRKYVHHNSTDLVLLRALLMHTYFGETRLWQVLFFEPRSCAA